jgi:hypothetical protein
MVDHGAGSRPINTVAVDVSDGQMVAVGQQVGLLLNRAYHRRICTGSLLSARRIDGHCGWTAKSTDLAQEAWLSVLEAGKGHWLPVGRPSVEASRERMEATLARGQRPSGRDTELIFVSQGHRCLAGCGLCPRSPSQRAGNPASMSEPAASPAATLPQPSFSTLKLRLAGSAVEPWRRIGRPDSPA